MTPTPTATLDRLITMFPSFEKHWNDEDIWREDDGSFTLHGLFIEFTDFIRDNFHAAPETARHELFHFIEASITHDDYDALDSAVCTCFLENFVGEPPLSGELRRYMGPKSKAFFDQWKYPEA